MKKFLLVISFLIVIFSIFTISRSFASSEVVFYGGSKSPCPVCGSKSNRHPYPSLDIYTVRKFAESLSNSERQFYCDASKNAVNQLVEALSPDVSTMDELVFTLDSSSLAKYFSLTLPSVYSYSRSTVDTSDFSFRFFSDTRWREAGFCFVFVDLNKNGLPNVLNKD